MEEERESLRKVVDDLVARAKNPDAAKNVLALLFPKAERVLKTYAPTGDEAASARWRGRRISVADFASAYFRLDPQPATWSKNELTSLLDLDRPSKAFDLVSHRAALVSNGEAARLRRLFLEFLDGAFGSERRFTAEWLLAIVDAAPAFLAAEGKQSDLFAIDNSLRVRQIIRRALEDESHEQRSEIFSAVIPAASDLSILCEFFRSTLGDVHPSGATDRESDYFGDDGGRLAGELLCRVVSLGRSGRIWEQAEPGKILWFWWGRDREAEVKVYMYNALETEVGLLALLEIPISEVSSSSGNYEKVSSYWSNIVDLRLLAMKAREMLALDVQVEIRQKAERFLSALKRGENDPFR